MGYRSAFIAGDRYPTGLFAPNETCRPASESTKKFSVSVNGDKPRARERQILCRTRCSLFNIGSQSHRYHLHHPVGGVHLYPCEYMTAAADGLRVAFPNQHCHGQKEEGFTASGSEFEGKARKTVSVYAGHSEPCDPTEAGLPGASQRQEGNRKNESCPLVEPERSSER